MAKHVQHCRPGETYARLTILSLAEMRKHSPRWRCQCACGAISANVADYHLRSGQTKSCGCLAKERGRPQPPGLARKRRDARRGKDPEFPKKRRANSTVKEAIRNGRIEPQPCEVCAAPKAHAHHEDYSKPLDVRWLCPKHHAARHRELSKAAE